MNKFRRALMDYEKMLSDYEKELEKLTESYKKYHKWYHSLKKPDPFLNEFSLENLSLEDIQNCYEQKKKEALPQFYPDNPDNPQETLSPSIPRETGYENWLKLNGLIRYYATRKYSLDEMRALLRGSNYNLSAQYFDIKYQNFVYICDFSGDSIELQPSFYYIDKNNVYHGFTIDDYQKLILSENL